MISKTPSLSNNHHAPSLFAAQLERRWVQLCTLLLATAALVRLYAMAVVPLTDTTEARYAEIARKMLETGNWVTLWHDYGVPFWAKPPLSSWLSAASMGLFGVNEFAVRLPNFLLMTAVIAMLGGWAGVHLGRMRGWLTALISASMLLIYALSGTVMTDICLVASTTLTMLAFWQALQSKQRRWGYLMFASLGIGLLAKGPMAVVFPGLAIAGWCLWRGQLLAALRSLPWFTGMVLMLVIAVPWYWLAEQRTPGFLNYFLVGEHLHRFLVSGWQGDMYGHAHEEPMGTIVLYWLEGTLPWSPVFAVLAWRQRAQVQLLFQRQADWHTYLLCWSLLPLVFFPARNIIPTYPLIGVPAFAVLMASLWPTLDPLRIPRLLPLTASINTALCLVLAVMATVLAPSQLPKMSQKRVVEDFLSAHPEVGANLYYYRRRFYSAEFYSHGHARVLSDWHQVKTLLDVGELSQLVVVDGDRDSIPAALQRRLHNGEQYGFVQVMTPSEVDAISLNEENNDVSTATP